MRAFVSVCLLLLMCTHL